MPEGGGTEKALNRQDAKYAKGKAFVFSPAGNPPAGEKTKLCAFLRDLCAFAVPLSVS